MKIALLGYPMAGKRTLFSLLTGLAVPPARKPGEAPEGGAQIRDPRVDVIAGICHPERKVYAANHFTLCPDVVEGAREWLDAIKKCDLLCLVVRDFASAQVFHPAGSVDAARDSQNLRAELLLADMEKIEKRLERIEREKKSGQTADQRVEEEAVRKGKAGLDGGKPLRELGLQPHELAAIRSLDFVTLLPVLEIRNVAEDDLAKPAAGDFLKVSAKFEQEITEIADPAERQTYLQTVGLDAPGLERVNAAAYAALGLMSFYTMGEDEARAWTIRRGSPAPVAGGKIHTDIQRGFIRVEVIKYDDLVKAGSEKAAKEQGRMQLRGKDYVLEDGDICHFLFNV